MCGGRHHSRSMYGEHDRERGYHGKRLSDFGLIPGLLTCLTCGKSYDADDIRFCSNCGTEFKTCPISKNKFRTGDEFAQCSSCYTVFHYHHLQDWLRRSGECPMCRKQVREIIRGTVGINRLVVPKI